MTSIDPRRLLSTASPLLSGRDVRASSPSTRFIVEAPVRDIWAGPLSDQDMLDPETTSNITPGVVQGVTIIAAQGLKVICSSAPIWDPQSPRRKEYRGHITVGEDSAGRHCFYALYTHGPGNNPNGQGKKDATAYHSLDQVLGAVNDQISKKLMGRGSSSQYMPKVTSRQDLIQRSTVEESLRSLARR